MRAPKSERTYDKDRIGERVVFRFEMSPDDVARLERILNDDHYNRYGWLVTLLKRARQGNVVTLTDIDDVEMFAKWWSRKQYE